MEPKHAVTTRKVIAVFDEVAEYYDAWYEEPMGQFVIKAESKVLNELLPGKGTGLDVGGGTGVFSRKLMELSEDRWIICLDPALRMLKRARGRSVDTVCGVASKLPFRPHVFDFAFAVTLLEFLENPLEDLSAIKEVLGEDATLVVMIINGNSEWGRLYAKLAVEGEPVLSMARLYEVEEAINVLRSAGYDVIGVVGALEEPPGEVPESEPKIRRGDATGCGVAFIECKVKVIQRAPPYRRST